MWRMDRYERCGGWAGMKDVMGRYERCGGWAGMKDVEDGQV